MWITKPTQRYTLNLCFPGPWHPAGYTPLTLDAEDAPTSIVRKTTVLDVMRRLLQVRWCGMGGGRWVGA